MMSFARYPFAESECSYTYFAETYRIHQSDAIQTTLQEIANTPTNFGKGLGVILEKLLAPLIANQKSDKDPIKSELIT